MERSGRRGVFGTSKFKRDNGRFPTNDTLMNAPLSRFTRGTGETMFIYISIVSTLIFIAEMITIAVLRRCKKTPIVIRYLSINFLASDAMFQIIGALFSVVKLTGIIKNVPVMKIGYQFSLGLTLSVSWASINLLALDRLIATILPLWYPSLVTRFRAALVILFVWWFNIIACSSSFIWFLVDCTVKKFICSGNKGTRSFFNDKQHLTHIVLFVVYELLNIAAYVTLALVLRNYFDRKRKHLALQKQMNRENS